jgi:hypothetical protein
MSSKKFDIPPLPPMSKKAMDVRRKMAMNEPKYVPIVVPLTQLVAPDSPREEEPEELVEEIEETLEFYDSDHTMPFIPNRTLKAESPIRSAKKGKKKRNVAEEQSPVTEVQNDNVNVGNPNTLAYPREKEDIELVKKYNQGAEETPIPDYPYAPSTKWSRREKPNPANFTSGKAQILTLEEEIDLEDHKQQMKIFSEKTKAFEEWKVKEILKIKHAREAERRNARRENQREAKIMSDAADLERYNLSMQEEYAKIQTNLEPEEHRSRHSGSSNSKPPWATENEGYGNEEVQPSQFVEDNDDYGIFLQKEMEANSPQKQEYKSYSSVVQSPPRKNKEITPPTNPPIQGGVNTKNSDKQYQNLIIHEGQSVLKLKDFNIEGWNAFSFDVQQRKNKKFDFMGTNCLDKKQVNMVFMQISEKKMRDDYPKYNTKEARKEALEYDEAYFMEAVRRSCTTVNKDAGGQVNNSIEGFKERLSKVRMKHYTGLNIQVVSDYGNAIMEIEREFQSSHSNRGLEIKEFRQLVKTILKVGIEQDFKQEFNKNKAMWKLTEDTRLRLTKESTEDYVEEPLKDFESLASYLYEVATNIGSI